MPYAMRRTKNGWGVQNTDSGDWKSRDTSHEKALAQLRLLNVKMEQEEGEPTPGWTPERAPRARRNAAKRKGRPWRPE